MKNTSTVEERITPKQALVWEVYSSVWTPWISIKWMQDLSSMYFSWKVNRKHARYTKQLNAKARLVKRIKDDKALEIREWMKKQ